jgi:hypothetical protein
MKPIHLTADFPRETLKARKVWNDVFQALKEDNCQPRSLYLVNKKSSHDKQKLEKFMTINPALTNTLKGIIHIEEEDKDTHENIRKNKSH